jgi:hypothetical protein
MYNDLNERQKAAVFYHVVGGCDDWVQLFIIAEGETRYNSLTDKSKRQTVSNFKRSDKITQAVADLKYRIERQKEEERKKIIQDWETESQNKQSFSGLNEDINFLDPEQFLKHANEQANRIKDDKERRSWLEMIAKLMNYKEANDQETTEIKRFYIMKACENCEIYQKCKDCNLSSCPK